MLINVSQGLLATNLLQKTSTLGNLVHNNQIKNYSNKRTDGEINAQ